VEVALGAGVGGPSVAVGAATGAWMGGRPAVGDAPRVAAPADAAAAEPAPTGPAPANVGQIPQPSLTSSSTVVANAGFTRLMVKTIEPTPEGNGSTTKSPVACVRSATSTVPLVVVRKCNERSWLFGEQLAFRAEMVTRS